MNLGVKSVVILFLGLAAGCAQESWKERSVRIRDLTLCDQTAGSSWPSLVEIRYEAFGFSLYTSRFLYLRILPSAMLEYDRPNLLGGCGSNHHTAKVPRTEVERIRKLLDSAEIRALRGTYGCGPGFDSELKLTVQISREGTPQTFYVVNPCPDGAHPMRVPVKRLLCTLDELRPIDSLMDYGVSQSLTCPIEQAR